MSRLDRGVAVVGGGAMGLTIAVVLAESGARVTLLDSAPLGDNASGVAAGMLAPAFEAALDPPAAGHFDLLRAGREAWTPLAQRLAPFGGAVERCGAAWVGDPASLDAMEAKLAASGATVRRLGAQEAAGLAPGLAAPDGAVFTPEDWRLDSPATLQALRAAFLAGGGRWLAAEVAAVEAGSVRLRSGETVETDAVVLATGLPPRGLAEAPAEVAALQPVKGQILRLRGAAAPGAPIVRAAGVYVTAASGDAVVGATMEAGVDDRRIDPAVAERLRTLAAGLFPALKVAPAEAMAGVRATTPDGLPLVGPSSTPGVLLALGARRNGWLLAPMAAEIIRAMLAGEDAGAWSDRFAPGRFRID